MKDYVPIVFVLKEHKLHKHLGPNHFLIEFLKSIKFVSRLILSGSAFYICGPRVFRLLSPNVTVL